MLVSSCLAANTDPSYHGILLNTKSNVLHITPSKSIRTRSPDNHSHICDIYVKDRKTDQVMSLDGKFFEWHEYKNMGRAIVGYLVAHQQYSAKYPTRYPWIDFNTSLSPGDGEQPTIVPSKALANHPLECTYLVYVFRSGDVVQAAYDPKGVMGRCALLQPNGINSIFFGAKETSANFSKYAIPEKMPAETQTLSVNSVMQTGLNKVDFLPLPNKAQLDHVFLIRQYDSSRLFDVTLFDMQGKKVSNQLCQFSPRPLDGVMGKIFKVGH